MVVCVCAYVQVMTGDNCTRLVVRLLSDIAQGRGASLPDVTVGIRLLAVFLLLSSLFRFASSSSTLSSVPPFLSLLSIPPFLLSFPFFFCLCQRFYSGGFHGIHQPVDVLILQGFADRRRDGILFLRPLR